MRVRERDQRERVFTVTVSVDDYFNWSHCKCYCVECYNPDTQPKVKSKGQPPEDYAIPIGWAKFALW